MSPEVSKVTSDGCWNKILLQVSTQFRAEILSLVRDDVGKQFLAISVLVGLPCTFSSPV